MERMLKVAMVLAVLASGSALGQSQEMQVIMQVEEPDFSAAPPIDPSKEAGAWHGRKKPSSKLNKAQKAALEERRKLVELMAQEVREKREALETSGSEQRAARVKELENLILEQSGVGAEKLERLEKLLEKQAKAQEKGLVNKLEKLEKAMEKNQEKLDKGVDKVKDKSKSPKSGK